MASKLDILTNTSLKLGGDTIQSESLTGTESDPYEVTVLVNLYETIKINELSNKEWNFNREQIEASQLPTAPIDVDWSTKYSLPSPSLDLIAVTDKLTGTEISYELRRGEILCNVDTGVICEYHADIDESEMPPYFVELLIARLCKESAYALTTDINLKQQFDEDYRQALYDAKLADSNTTPADTFIADDTSSYLRARSL
ncbi:hypothetical protein V5T82_14195 [Magnetovibrio sp. PR-2]|uniref:hypothetical protein n=1 Tax=Magnetovibrio sp. PR-2 TaxID=3120356 RepID=UPI002FCDF95D